MCIPIIFLTRRSAVDFPQDGAPIPVGTGHDSKANKVIINISNACTINILHSFVQRIECQHQLTHFFYLED
jgi:hypothetical protein